MWEENLNSIAEQKNQCGALRAWGTQISSPLFPFGDLIPIWWWEWRHKLFGRSRTACNSRLSAVICAGQVDQTSGKCSFESGALINKDHHKGWSTGQRGLVGSRGGWAPLSPLNISNYAAASECCANTRSLISPQISRSVASPETLMEWEANPTRSQKYAHSGPWDDEFLLIDFHISHKVAEENILVIKILLMRRFDYFLADLWVFWICFVSNLSKMKDSEQCGHFGVTATPRACSGFSTVEAFICKFLVFMMVAIKD